MIAYTPPFHAEVSARMDAIVHPLLSLSPDTPSRGHEDYARLGVLWTKPGRADAPRVLSMSRSDEVYNSVREHVFLSSFSFRVTEGHSVSSVQYFDRLVILIFDCKRRVASPGLRRPSNDGVHASVCL